MIVTRAQTSSNQQVQKYNFALYLVLPLEVSVFYRKVLLSSLKLPFPSTHWTMRLGSLGVYPLQDTVKMKCMVAGTPYCKDDNDQIAMYMAIMIRLQCTWGPQQLKLQKGTTMQRKVGTGKRISLSSLTAFSKVVKDTEQTNILRILV